MFEEDEMQIVGQVDGSRGVEESAGKFVRCFTKRVGQEMVFDIIPDLFDRIQFGRVFGQRDEGKPFWMKRFKIESCRLMTGKIVPNDIRPTS